MTEQAFHTPVTYEPLVFRTSMEVTQKAGVQWWQIVLCIWILGCAVFCAYHLIRYFRFHSMTKRWSVRLENDRIDEMAAMQKVRLGISAKIEIYVCSCISSPMLTGLLKPKILLPAYMKIAEDELELILRHELIHYSRRDIWYKLLILVAAAMHWFNPAVYIMAGQIASLCEISCDEKTVKALDIKARIRYSETILYMQKSKGLNKTVLSTNFYGGKIDMRNRVSSIIRNEKKKIGFIALCLTFLMTLGAGAAYTASTPETVVPDETVTTNRADMIDANIIFRKYMNEGQTPLYASYPDSRPEFEFYIDGRDITRVELQCDNEYLYVIDWSKEHSGSELIYRNKLSIEFGEEFEDYTKIWFRWKAVNLYEWAAKDGYAGFLGANTKPGPDMTEEEKLKLASGSEGIGHIQLEGYPANLLEDKITVRITDINGDFTIKTISINITNKQKHQTVVPAGLDK